MKKWLLALTLLTFLGMATGFQASMEPLNRQATPEDPAVFQITIENTGTVDRRFTLDYSFRNVGWIYFDTSRTIPAGETERINVTIDPDEDAIQQSYSFTIYVQDTLSGNSTSFTDYMSVERQYELNVKDFTVDKSSYMPGEEVTGTMTVQNLAPKIIDNYSLYSSFSGENKTQEGIAIAPGALKTYSFTHSIPEEAYPGQRNFSITLDYESRQQIRYSNINVKEIRNVSRTTEREDKVLYETGEIRVENLGNSNVTLTENLTFPTYLSSILSFETEPDDTEETSSSITYIWNLDLQPGESVVLEYRIDYWMPLAIAALILIGVVALRRLSGSVEITKKVEEVEGDKLKISIELVNNSEKIQEGLKVKDFVPNVAQLDEEFHMTRPDTKRTTDGVELEWSVDDFKPGEERVIQYEIEPKVEVEGGIDLESAELRKEGQILRKSKRK